MMSDKIEEIRARWADDVRVSEWRTAGDRAGLFHNGYRISAQVAYKDIQTLLAEVDNLRRNLNGRNSFITKSYTGVAQTEALTRRKSNTTPPTARGDKE